VLSSLGSDRAAVSNEFAESKDVGMGDSLRFLTPEGNEVTYEVAGVYNSAAGVVGGVVLSNSSLESSWGVDYIAFALVAGDEGALPVGVLIGVAVLAAIAGVLAAIPPARRAARVDVLRAVTTE
jgi:hypothetical protein